MLAAGLPAGTGPAYAWGPTFVPSAPPAKVVVVPPAATASLLRAVTASVRQMESLTAYDEALSYARTARARSLAAATSLTGAITAWSSATVSDEQAEIAEAAASANANLYQQALSELGIIEYTGQAAQYGTDLAAEEHEVDEVQLGDVAAKDTISGLQAANGLLAVTRAHLQATRAILGATWAAIVSARQELTAARANVVRSVRALVDARRWAALPGLAPPEPAAALASIEKSAGTPAAGSARAARAAGGSRSVELAALARPAAGGTPATASQQDDQFSSQGPTILGPAVLSGAQIAAWFASTGAQANTTVPITTLINDYVKAGRLTGVRADVAFAQSVVETGYFSFPAGGQDARSYNNFAGIGACDTCKHGWKFASAMDGVLAQQDLLSEYASTFVPDGAHATARARLGVAGCCQTWMGLAGVWATNPAYGFEILSVYNEMLNWALKSELARVGLGGLSASPTVATG